MFEALESERSLEEREHGEMWWCREHQGIVTLRDFIGSLGGKGGVKKSRAEHNVARHGVKTDFCS